jgi:hypothetical protein
MASRWGLVPLAVVLLAGCGTTVSGTGPGNASVGGDVGLAAPPVASPSSGAVGGGVGGTTSGGSLAGGSPPTLAAGGAGSSGSVGSAGAPGTQGSGALPATGHGYDAQHVYLGFPTNTDVSKAAPAGLGASAFGDQEGQIKAVVADANRHGGLFGRTIVPVFHDMKTADLQANPENQAQATCVALTEDHTVVAVINIVAAIDLPTFYACLAKHGTPIISAGFIPVDDQLFATYAPYLYKTTSASFTALSPVWIDRLIAMGYFHGWNTAAGASASTPAKVGLLYPNRQPQQRIFAALKSRLAAKGIQVVKDFQYDASSLDRESADMSNAVLQFRDAGVTHVLSSEADVLLFMTAADGQHYRPRYGLNSYHAAAVQLQGTVPASQLVGSMGVGWLPITDVDAAHNPGSVGPGEKRCREIMSKAGQDISSAAPAVVAFALCDGVHMVAQGMSVSGSPTPQGLRDGLSSVGATFQSALTWRCALANRYDLPGAVRDFRYDNGAYHYVSTQNQPL